MIAKTRVTLNKDQCRLRNGPSNAGCRAMIPAVAEGAEDGWGSILICALERLKFSLPEPCDGPGTNGADIAARLDRHRGGAWLHRAPVPGRELWRPHSRHRRTAAPSLMIYPLSLAIYCTSWTFFGSVGLASRTGYEFLTIYVGPVLMIGLFFRR